MPTADESNHSANGTLHPHRTDTRHTTTNDVIGVHTVNYCDYFCTIERSELVYGHVDLQTLQCHNAHLGFTLFQWLQSSKLSITSLCFLSKNSNSVRISFAAGRPMPAACGGKKCEITASFLTISHKLQLRSWKWLYHWKASEQTFPAIYGPYANIVNFSRTSQIYFC